MKVKASSRFDCYMVTNKKVYGVCVQQENDIVDLRGGLAHMGANSYTGDIYVTFKVQNPDSNKDEGVFLEVELYYSEAMQYKISQIKGAYLMPSFECKYPCETCSPFDAFDCQTCPQGRN